MAKKSNKISTRWISTTRDDFKAFLKETCFPAPDRLGERGANIQISGVVDHVHCSSIR